MTEIAKLQRQLEWAKSIRMDENHDTRAYLLADAVIEMTEAALEIEVLKQEQVDRFSNSVMASKGLDL